MRWVIISGTYNIGPLAGDFCRYHLSLGANKIYLVDYGSRDDTLAALEPFVRTGSVHLLPLPTHRFVDYDPSKELLTLVRAEGGADWVSFLDPDEFLVGAGDVRSALTRAQEAGWEVLEVARRNLTGIGPLPDGSPFLEHLTLKIIEPDARVASASAPLSSPWIFSRLPPKVTIAAGRPDITTTPGDHAALGALPEKVLAHPSLEILHFPIRDFESFRLKVVASAKYLSDNPEFAPGIAWHWRRWVALLENGGLRAEYESQFPSSEVTQSLLQEGRVIHDRRLAEWQSRGR